MMTKRRLVRGFTLPEAVIGAVISTMVLGTVLSLFIAGASTWVRGAELIDVETQSRQAVRVISDELRQAMGVVVETGGQGVTYRIPARSGTGAFNSPPVWDNVTRRIYHSSGSLLMSTQTGGTTVVRTITRNVILTDPDNGNAAYTIFTAGTGGVVRDVAVRIVTRRTLPNNQVFLGRKREIVYLRNIPRVTQ